jgi:hypothetical protein
MDPHDLYGLPLDRFTPERTALAKELRKAGRREEAEAVAKLRKPSLAAWATNQLVRTQTRAVAELFRAGDAVQQAQASLLSGDGESEALRDALGRERRAVRDLVEVARGLLSSDGHGLTPATLERVAETLEAAALEADARTQVRDGCLDRELRHVGLGAVSPPGPETKSRRGRSSSSSRAPRPDRAALRRREAETRRAAEQATRAVKAAEAARDAAAQTLAGAEAALELARERLEEAAAAHRDAEEQLRSCR